MIQGLKEKQKKQGQNPKAFSLQQTLPGGAKQVRLTNEWALNGTKKLSRVQASRATRHFQR